MNTDNTTYKFLRILTSIPVILIVLYYFKVLGVFLILVRFITYRGSKKISLPILLFGIGIIILIPRIIVEMLKLIQFDVAKIPVLNDIVTSEIYDVNLMGYSKALIIIGVVIAALSYAAKIAMQHAINKLTGGLTSYFEAEEKQEREIAEKNDMIMREKQEKAKNTHAVTCPYCGADNMITSEIGTCKYCRRKIVYKQK